MPTTIQNSSYLDLTAYRVVEDLTQTVEGAYGVTGVPYAGTPVRGLNFALVLPRANEPTFLSGTWAERQRILSQGDALFDTYGASQADYQAALDVVNGFGITILDSSNSYYVSSQASRTIWVQISDAVQFNQLFGAQLMYTSGGDFLYWDGNLTVPSGLNIAGLWVDYSNSPDPQNFAGTPQANLTQGWQSIGNATAAPQETLSPATIAAGYNFPLSGHSVQTDPIAVIEPGVGAALIGAAQETGFQTLLAQYLAAIGVTGTGTVYTQGEGGQRYSFDAAGERSLDVGIVAAINPNSTLGLYSGSGDVFSATRFAKSTVFTAYQSAIWDTANNPKVITSSWTEINSSSPSSPFQAAYRELMIDAALRNITLFQDAFDGGSGNETGNGLTNVSFNNASSFIVVVGGTSLSSLQAALGDPTLVDMANAALAGDMTVIWDMVQGGLTVMPANAQAATNIIETVWNQYYVQGSVIEGYYAGTPVSGGGYSVNWAGTGGVDPTQSVPAYQQDYGLRPVSADPQAVTGRGVPDVSALSQGNQYYLTPNANMVGAGPEGGTSASTPFWAALGVQLNAIFVDQGLPRLGYMNDLLYIASAMTPAAFNDVTLGNNVSSYVAGVGTYLDDGNPVMPTGFGYYAGPGYDYVTGLGTPNGTLLARALVDIAHSQMYFSSSPDILETSGDGWVSGVDQSVVFQSMSGFGMVVGLGLGSSGASFTTGPSAAFAWTARFAEQSLQSDFDPALARLYDRQSQGFAGATHLSSGENLSVSINGGAAQAVQGTLTTDFGFADFMTSQGAVRVAQPVMAAETPSGLDDRTAIVRLRQNGQDSLGITFYRVDDYNGSIGNLHPGDADYAAATQARAYQTASGSTIIQGPGYGNYGQSALLHVNAGDLIAQVLTDSTTGISYFSFARANESVAGQNIVHQWNYGHNVVGWEDIYGGGDYDFNDLVVGLDFTSAYGHGWLV